MLRSMRLPISPRPSSSSAIAPGRWRPCGEHISPSIISTAKTNDWEIFGTLCEVAKHQREAGDSIAARRTLDRLVKLVESLKDFPEWKSWCMTREPTSRDREKHEMGAFLRCELLVVIADERLALGDRDVACVLYRRRSRPSLAEGFLKPMFLAGIGSKLFQAGDATGGRDVIEQASGMPLN